MAPNSKGLPGERVDGLEPDSLNLVVEHVDQEVERQDGQGRIFDGQPRQGLFFCGTVGHFGIWLDFFYPCSGSQT